jgi:hypothetical protein
MMAAPFGAANSPFDLWLAEINCCPVVTPSLEE